MATHGLGGTHDQHPRPAPDDRAAEHRGRGPHPPPPAAEPAPRTARPLIIAAGLIFAVAGAGTWMLVRSSLAAEQITVSPDAAHFGGQHVKGPLTAYYQADIIKHHSLKASGGKTYAQLEKTDPVRTTVMTGSFLRASLFTSVLAFGIAAMAMGLGLLFVIIGFALRAARSSTA